MSAPDLTALPKIELRAGEPVFAEPWEAQVFAMTVALHERGTFGWDEWAEALSREIHGGTERPYYRHWCAALERLLDEKAITPAPDVAAREAAWHEAAARTPHGEVIEL